MNRSLGGRRKPWPSSAACYAVRPCVFRSYIEFS
jgi:hypothetical protein